MTRRRACGHGDAAPARAAELCAAARTRRGPAAPRRSPLGSPQGARAAVERGRHRTDSASWLAGARENDARAPWGREADPPWARAARGAAEPAAQRSGADGRGGPGWGERAAVARPSRARERSGVGGRGRPFAGKRPAVAPGRGNGWRRDLRTAARPAAFYSDGGGREPAAALFRTRAPTLAWYPATARGGVGPPGGGCGFQGRGRSSSVPLRSGPCVSAVTLEVPAAGNETAVRLWPSSWRQLVPWDPCAGALRVMRGRQRVCCWAAAPCRSPFLNPGTDHCLGVLAGR